MLTDWEQPVRTHRGDSLLNSIVTTRLQACNSLRVFTCVGVFIEVFQITKRAKTLMLVFCKVLKQLAILSHQL